MEKNAAKTHINTIFPKGGCQNNIQLNYNTVCDSPLLSKKS